MSLVKAATEVGIELALMWEIVDKSGAGKGFARQQEIEEKLWRE